MKIQSDRPLQVSLANGDSFPLEPGDSVDVTAKVAADIANVAGITGATAADEKKLSKLRATTDATNNQPEDEESA